MTIAGPGSSLSSQPVRPGNFRNTSGQTPSSSSTTVRAASFPRLRGELTLRDLGLPQSKAFTFTGQTQHQRQRSRIGTLSASRYDLLAQPASWFIDISLTRSSSHRRRSTQPSGTWTRPCWPNSGGCSTTSSHQQRAVSLSDDESGVLCMHASLQRERKMARDSDRDPLRGQRRHS